MKMLIKLILFAIFAFFGVCAYSQTNISRESQLIFYTDVIPRCKNITITGSSESYSNNEGRTLSGGNINWRLTIDDKYNVTFTGELSSYSHGHNDNYRNNNIYINRNAHGIVSSRKGNKGVAVSYRGSGALVWDDDKMKINLSINASGTCSGTVYVTIYEALRANADRRKTVDDSEEITSYGNSAINLSIDLTVDYSLVNNNEPMKLLLNQNRLIMNMSGEWLHYLQDTQVHFSYPCSISSNIGGNTWYTAEVSHKTQAEMASLSDDEFGKWNWNENRTRLFLKAQNSENKLIIVNENGNLFFGLEMIKGTKGISESTTDKGDKLVNFSFAFDKDPSQIFSFIENNGENLGQNLTIFNYAVYNRFLGNIDRNSNSVFSNIKDKKTIILSYTINNTRKTDIFSIGGLETILDYLEK